MGTRPDHAALAARWRGQRGQAFTELALVLFLFFLFLTAVLQLVWLGSAQIRCQLAARRAAWLWNVCKNSDLTGRGVPELQSLLPGCSDPVPVGGFSCENGSAFEVSYTVPAIGFFRMVKPSGFKVSARSAVIAYNERPIANTELNRIWNWVRDRLGLH